MEPIGVDHVGMGTGSGSGSGTGAGGTLPVVGPVDPELGVTPIGSAPVPSSGASGTVAGWRLVGRFDQSDPTGPRFNWPASTIEADFEGTEAYANLWQESTVDRIQFTVVVDAQAPRIVQSEPGPARLVALATALGPGSHRVRLIRNSEGLFGLSQFKGFAFGASGRLLPPPPARSRLFEFIGDSLTAGYGALGDDPTCRFNVTNESAYASFALVTGRLLDADVSVVAISGIGVHRNLQQQAGDAPTMLAHYDTVTQGGAPYAFGEAKQPDVVVINLGTNDYGGGAPEGEAFIASYRQMITKVRARRPNALIVCGTLAVLADVAATDHATVKDTVRIAVERQVAAGDAKIVWAPLFNPGSGQGRGCDAHLSAAQNQDVAAALAAVIRAH